eukprot:TRINITY_DN28985_c1_g1_i1.p1 TRINITY_DN28985_c1_g1~~TRINITY_DN28985_c1_g1_i1.p1  ORF type:complete len:342 (-),score=45.65 TRINITY_DN28985_c1_g1_i1:348-1373(-)
MYRSKALRSIASKLYSVGSKAAESETGAYGSHMARIYSSTATSAASAQPFSPTKARGIAAPVGMLAGIFGSLVGVGGGVLIVPMIVGVQKDIPQRIISGTSLAAVIATGCTATYTYGSSGYVDPVYAAVIAVTAIATAPLGAKMTKVIDSLTLRRILGYFLMAVAPLVPIKQMLFSQQKEKKEEEGQSASPSEEKTLLQSRMDRVEKDGIINTVIYDINSLILGATGVIAGFASGLLGIGGGTIVTPLLAMTTSMDQKEVLGTSLLAMIIPSLVGLIQHWRIGNVDWIMGMGLAAGTVFGSYVGSNFALQAPPGVLESAFAGGMLFLGYKTLQAARVVKKL